MPAFLDGASLTEAKMGFSGLCLKETKGTEQLLYPHVALQGSR